MYPVFPLYSSLRFLFLFSCKMSCFLFALLFIGLTGTYIETLNGEMTLRDLSFPRHSRKARSLVNTKTSQLTEEGLFIQQVFNAMSKFNQKCRLPNIPNGWKGKVRDMVNSQGVITDFTKVGIPAIHSYGTLLVGIKHSMAFILQHNEKTSFESSKQLATYRRPIFEAIPMIDTIVSGRQERYDAAAAEAKKTGKPDKDGEHHKEILKLWKILQRDVKNIEVTKIPEF